MKSFLLRMAAPSKDVTDVTLALVDQDLLQCWKLKVKQGKECSLLLDFTNGKLSTTLKLSDPRIPEAKSNSLESFKVKTPKTPTSSDAHAEKKKKKPRDIGTKNKLEKLLAYHQRLVDEKGLPPSRLMIEHAAAVAKALAEAAGTHSAKEAGSTSAGVAGTTPSKAVATASAEKVLKGDQCDFKCDNLTAWNKYINSQHKEHKCKKCKQTFTSTIGLLNHEADKHGIKIQECETPVVCELIGCCWCKYQD